MEHGRASDYTSLAKTLRRSSSRNLPLLQRRKSKMLDRMLPSSRIAFKLYRSRTSSFSIGSSRSSYHDCKSETSSSRSLRCFILRAAKIPTESRGLGKAEESGWFSPGKTGCSGGIRGVEEHPQGIPSVLCRLNPKQRKRPQNDTLMADMSATECWEAAERGRGFTLEHPLNQSL